MKRKLSMVAKSPDPVGKLMRKLSSAYGLKKAVIKAWDHVLNKGKKY